MVCVQFVDPWHPRITRSGLNDTGSCSTQKAIVRTRTEQIFSKDNAGEKVQKKLNFFILTHAGQMILNFYFLFFIFLLELGLYAQLNVD